MIERTTARLLAENRALRARVRKLERAQARRSAAGAPARHSGRFRTLAEVSVLINAPLSLDDVLRVVTEEARRIIGAHHAVVSARVDGDRVVEVVSLSEKYAPGRGAAVPDASAIGRLVSEAKRPVRLTRAELATHPGWRTVAAVRDGRPPFRGVLAAPLTARDGTSIGFIQFSDRYRGEFTVEDAAVLLLLAQTVSVALENARLYADATRRRVEAETLARVAGRLTESLDLETVGTQIVESVLALFGVDASSLLLLRPDGALVRLAAAGRPRDRLAAGHVIPAGVGVVGRAAREGRAVWTPDVTTDPDIVRNDELRRMDAETGTRAILAVPLRVKDKVIGVLAVVAQAVRRFTAGEVGLLQAFADQAAVALENARLYAEATRRRREAEELARVARTVTESLDWAALGDRIVQSVLQIFDLEASALRLRQPDGSLAVIARGGSLGERFDLGHVLPAGVGVAGRAVAEGRAVWSPDVLADPSVVLTDDARRQFLDSGIRAVLAVPLRPKGVVRGVLLVGGREPRAFSAADVALLEAFADQAAVALDNATLYAESERRRRAADGLAQVGRALSRSLEPDDVRQRIASSTVALLGCPDSVLYRLRPESGELVAVTMSDDLAAALGRELVLPAGTGAAGLAVSTRAPVATRDCLTDPRIVLAAETRARLEQGGYRAALAVPMLVQDRVIGALTVAERTGRVFGADDVELAQAFADQAGLALENARLYAEATHRRRQAEELARLVRTVTERLDVTTVGQRIVESVQTLLGVQGAALRVLEPDGSLLAVANAGEAPHFYPGHRLPPGVGVAGRAVAEGRPVWTADWSRDPDLTLTDDVRRRLAGAGYRAVLSAPLRIRGETIGALSVADGVPHEFSPEEARLLEAFSDHAALALENARLYETAERRRREAEALAEVGRLIAQSLDTDVVVRTILHSARRLLGTVVATLYRLEPDSGELVALAASGDVGLGLDRAFAYPRGMGLVGRAVEEGRPVVSADVVMDPHLTHPPEVIARLERASFRAALAVPLTVMDRVIGVLGTGDRAGRVFGADEIRLLQVLADRAAVALENARLYAETKRRLTELTTVQRVARAINSSLELDAVFRAVVDEISTGFGFRRVSISLRDADALVLQAQVGYAHAIERIPLDRGTSGRVARTGQAELVRDASRDPEFLYAEPDVRQAIVAPLKSGDGEVLGILAVESTGEPELTETDLGLLTLLADQVSVAVANARLYGETARRQREAAMVARLARSLTETLDVAAVGRRVVQSVLPLFGARFARLRVLQPDGSLKTAARADAAGVVADSEGVLPPGVGISARVVAEGRAVWTRDLLDEATVTLSDSLRRRVDAAGNRAVLAVPLRVKGAVTGVLSIADQAGRGYSDAEVGLLQTIANQAAVALDNAQLYQETERRRREAEVMAGVTRALNASLDLDTVLRRVAEGARELCAGDTALVGLRDPGSDALVFRHGLGAGVEGRSLPRIETGKGVGGLVLATGRAFRTDDYAADPRITKDYMDAAREAGVISAVVVPITIEGQVEGTLSVGSHAPGRFTDADETVLLRLADHAAIAIRNARAFAREQGARAAAEESEQRFRDLVESLDAVVWEADAATGRFSFVSRRGEAMLGYSVGQWLTDPGFWISLVHPEDREQALALRRAGAAEGLDHEFEYRAVAADGRVVWLHDVVRVARDAEGRPRQLRGVMVDVTPRRTADEVLRRSEARFRIAAECASDLIYEWDIPTGRVEYFGPVDALLGYAPGEFPRTLGGREAVIHPDDRARVMAELDRALALGEAVDIEYRVLRRDGTPRYWTDRGTVLADERGTPSKWIGAATDVTERRQAQEALRDSEARYRSVIAALAEGVVLQDADGAIRACNASAERILGLSADQMTGRTTLDASWRAIHEDGSPFPVEEHPAMVTLRTGRPCTNVVLGLPQAGGALTWISINTQPLLHEGDTRPYAVVASYTDITERKQAERERTELLDRVITAQEEERRRVARELHDQMGQDLTALLLGLKALEQPLIWPAGRRARELQELVKQLMQRVHRLAWELRPTALDDWGLETALRRYAEEWSRRAGPPVDFHSNGLEDRRVPADVATALYRIAQEALTNVVRHAAASRASVLLEARPGHVQMIVDDDGRGFEVGPLSGAGPSPRRLGLLGMQERVWLVGGTLTIESAPGAGTTVFVRIPLPEGEATP